MTNFKRISFFFFILLQSACQSPAPETDQANKEETEATFSFNWEAIADKLLERMDLQAGERVMMVGKPGVFDPLVPLLRMRIAAAQAEDLGVFSVTDTAPEGWGSAFVEGSKGMNREQMVAYFQDVDLGIMLPGAVPSDLPYGAMQDLLWQNRGRTIHFHWTGAYTLNGLVRPVDDEINAFYQKVLLETNYAGLKKAQKMFETAMRGQTIRVTTPLGTDISFQIGDRPVTKQDGDASAAHTNQGRNLIDREVELPAGAIRVAPIETSVEGKIAFPDSDWNGTQVEGLVLNFSAGKVTEWTATSGKEAVEAVFKEKGKVAQSFREFALGMNPMLAIQGSDNPWIPYYGYGGGVVRLSLGNNAELGGNVTDGDFVRWNFFTDATVKVGDDVWVQDGKLIQ
mgnify:CR=1 FL=1